MEKHYYLYHPDLGFDPDYIKPNELPEPLSGIAMIMSSSEDLPYVTSGAKENLPSKKLTAEFSSYLSSQQVSSSEAFLKYTDFLSSKQATINVGCLCNATSALYLALKAAGVEGGEVITTSFNYVGVLNAIIMAGASPVFVDIQRDTWQMDFEALKSVIGKKTRAIVLTHVNSHLDMAPLISIYKEMGLELPLIQDASLAIGSTNSGISPGIINLGRGGCTVFSLAPSKIISGLGGALVTSENLETLKQMIVMAGQGVSGIHLEAFGGNFRINELNASIALGQLKRRDELFSKRRRLKKLYDVRFSSIKTAKGVKPQSLSDECVPTHYGIELPDSQRIAEALYRKHRIALGFWHSHHLEAIYIKKFGVPRKPMPNTESIAATACYVPFHSLLLDEDVSLICDAIERELS
jgi:perosamine synthetase